MGMPYGYNNTPYTNTPYTKGQNPYAGYHTAQQQAPVKVQQNEYPAQPNGQDLGNNITNAALVGGVVGATAGGIGALGGEEGNFKQRYAYEQGGKKYDVTFKGSGSSNPIVKRFDAQSDNGGKFVQSLVRDAGNGKKIIYEFPSYYKGDLNTPRGATILIHDGSSPNPTKLVFELDEHNNLALKKISLPTSGRFSPKEINPKHLRLDPDLLSDLDTRRKNAKNGILSNKVSSDLGQRMASLKRAKKEIELARNALGEYYDWVENLAKNGLKEGVDFPNLEKVAQEARVDKALDWSGMLKNVAKSGGIGLLVAGLGAGVLTLLTQRRPAYARQSSPAPSEYERLMAQSNASRQAMPTQGFRPY